MQQLHQEQVHTWQKGHPEMPRYKAHPLPYGEQAISLLILNSHFLP